MNIQDLEFDGFTAFEGGASTAYSSPAIPTAFDLNASGSSSASNMGTVSPQDLMLREPFGSAPNSAAYTALTSPSIYNESPDLHDGYDVSPNFATGDFEVATEWFPLFPQSNKAPEQQSADSQDSPAQNSDELENPQPRSSHRRSKSGNNSPGNARRPSAVAGVNSRKRDKPLPAIIIEDPTDPVAMKRARNTLAARKSRDRKAKKSEDQEAQIARLTEEVDYWKRIAQARSGGQ